MRKYMKAQPEPQKAIYLFIYKSLAYTLEHMLWSRRGIQRSSIGL